MKVLKFGGSSLGTPERVKQAIGIIKKARQGGKVAVVVSAFEGVTNELIRIAEIAASGHKEYIAALEALKKRHLDAARALVPAKKRRPALLKINSLFNELGEALRGVCLTRELSKKTLDFVMSFGERLSAFIVSETAKANHLSAEFLDTRGVIITDENFGNAAVDAKTSHKNLQDYFAHHKDLQIATGFIASTKGNETTTLGRGGSDYTAALLGAALGASTIEIWTDVPGVMSADPRIVKNAKVLPKIDYEEMIEMAYFGAKVVHPATMLPAIQTKIPVIIKNTFDPDSPGTFISAATAADLPIKGVTSIDDVALVNLIGTSLAGIPGSAARVFEATKRAKANVILISQASSEHTICIAVKSGEAEAAVKCFNDEFSAEIASGKVSLSTTSDQSVVAIVGGGMKGVPDTAGKLFHALGTHGVNISAIAQGSSEKNISFVVASKDRVKAISTVHGRFFDNGVKNIFLAGTGNVGRALLGQIISLNTKAAGGIRLCGVINSKKMFVDESGVNPANFEKSLKKGDVANLGNWIEAIKAMHLPNKIFVDCTACDGFAEKYIGLAEVGFHIVTPNKKFNVAPLGTYQKLRAVLAKSGRQFLYDANVGGGLPVIPTIKNLIASGDKILKIEGIFSGTLNFIWSRYNGRVPFSMLVAKAKELGLTEPDPRDDLSGEDVGRKLLILARETGSTAEFKDVKIENLVPKSLRAVVPKEFMKRLPEYDVYFQKLFDQAKSQGKVLRYVASVHGKNLRAALAAVKKDHPLAGVMDADNAFVFWTKNYRKTPLVIKGPGAGPQVTAASVLSNIVRLS